jgi:hypothetical protein
VCLSKNLCIYVVCIYIVCIHASMLYASMHLYSMLSALCGCVCVSGWAVGSSLYTITLHPVHCSLLSALCSVFCVLCSLYPVHCSLYTLLSVHYTLFSVQASLGLYSPPQSPYTLYRSFLFLPCMAV